MDAPVTTAPSPLARRQRRHSWLVGVTVALLIVAVLTAAWWWLYASHYQNTDDAYVAGDLVSVMSQVNGTVVAIDADETDQVHAGQELVRLDATDAGIALQDAEQQLARKVRQTHTVFANRDQLAAVLPLPPRLRSEALRCHTDGLNGRRGLGWGLRGDRWDNMGDGWPESGAGHTGFTGTSLSLDSRSGLWAVLLTNAVHFGRGPEHSVVGLRKHVHAAVAAALGPVAENRDRD